MSDHWIDRAQTAEASLATKQQVVDSLKEELRIIKETFGIKGNSAGYNIDYAVLVANLGPDQCAELREVM